MIVLKKPNREKKAVSSGGDEGYFLTQQIRVHPSP